MPIRLHLLIFCLLNACASHSVQTTPYSNVKLGDWTITQDLKSDGVILVPQWHLSPGTKIQTELPQGKNQLAIYNQLKLWIAAHSIDDLIAEGCEGKLENQNNKKFNGWSLQELKDELSQNKDIDAILAPVAFKVEAKSGRDINVTCGDSDELIVKHQLVLSNLRGLAGFKYRIEQPNLLKSDRKSYVKTAAEVLHMSPDSSSEEVLAKINAQLADSLTQFENLLHERDQKFVEVAEHLPGIKVIVIGAIHIPDLETQLKNKSIPFSVWTPVGLDDQDSQIIEQLKKSLNLKGHS